MFCDAQTFDYFQTIFNKDHDIVMTKITIHVESNNSKPCIQKNKWADIVHIVHEK